VPDEIMADYVAGNERDRFFESMRYARAYPTDLAAVTGGGRKVIRAARGTSLLVGRTGPIRLPCSLGIDEVGRCSRLLTRSMRTPPLQVAGSRTAGSQCVNRVIKTDSDDGLSLRGGSDSKTD
jgi:hypothetical protein